MSYLYLELPSFYLELKFVLAFSAIRTVEHKSPAAQESDRASTGGDPPI